ncbi:MAG: hypothetical protein IKI11_08550 [Neisseriaceae bacterium]|nr:hypothetical protein [Neisseriaceae bacterium]MBR7002693.1 hypothetical protein [Neisseriaceae bacterium]
MNNIFSGSLNLILCVIARFERSSNRGNPVKKSLDFFINADKRCNALLSLQIQVA